MKIPVTHGIFQVRSPGAGGGGRTSHMKGVGMLVGNLKKTDLSLAEALFDP